MSDEIVSSRTVRQLYQAKAKSLEIRLAAGANGLDNPITSARIQKMGLSLAGYTDYLQRGRVQFIGRSEMGLLSNFTEEQRCEALRRTFSLGVCCIVITGGMSPPAVLLTLAKEYEVPILITPLPTVRTVDEITEFLEERLSPSTSIHGVLIDVYGLGVLITGRSGIGKSECGLELVMRGHRLVTDDMVVLRRFGAERLMGLGPDQMKYHMEVRGLGVINIRELFGISSVTGQKQVELAVELVHWRDWQEEDRLQFEEKECRLLDCSVPLITMPVASGRNVATLVEVAVRIQLLKKQGYRPSAEFLDSLHARLTGMEDDSVD